MSIYSQCFFYQRDALTLCVARSLPSSGVRLLKSDTVVDISPIPTAFPQKFLPPHPIPISFNPLPIGCITTPPHSHEIHPIPFRSAVLYISADNLTVYRRHKKKTRSSADADNRLDAFSGQSRSTNMVPFHMLHIVSYCAIVTLSLRHQRSLNIGLQKNFMTLKWGQRSLKVIESGIIR